MESIQTVALKRAINTLTALNCQFAVITPEGEKFGELEVEASTKPRKNKHKQGELKSYVETFLAPVQVGKDFSVPCGDYDMETTVRSVSNWFYKTYGAGSYRYQTDKYANAVHGIRIK
jgi:hypothetical protein